MSSEYRAPTPAEIDLVDRACDGLITRPGEYGPGNALSAAGGNEPSVYSVLYAESRAARELGLDPNRRGSWTPEQRITALRRALTRLQAVPHMDTSRPNGQQIPR